MFVLISDCEMEYVKNGRDPEKPVRERKALPLIQRGNADSGNGHSPATAPPPMISLLVLGGGGPPDPESRRESSRRRGENTHPWCFAENIQGRSPFRRAYNLTIL